MSGHDRAEHAIERKVRFKVITPVFGGGVSNASTETERHLKEPDRITPLRGAAIRGQLRFWWRVLQNETDHKKLWEAEKRIWGMASEPGVVSIKVQASTSWEEVPVFTCERKGTRWQVKPIGGMQAIAYGAFPLQPPKEELEKRDAPKPGVLHRCSAECELELRFPIHLREEIENAVNAWLLLGGVGGRTRRGFGAISCDELSVDPVRWLQKRGFSLKVTAQSWRSAEEAWKFGLEKLQRFRQEKQVGRNIGSNPARPYVPGRSRWPEPECIRSLTDQSDIQHRARLVGVDKFPRAAFGLPIIFHFQSRQDPEETRLKPVGFERLASPLIIRPYRAPDGKYGCLAALLPYRELDKVQLELTGEGGSWAVDPALTATEAQSLKSPLRGEPDPLLAFLNFFQRSQATENIP
jgi:CRISPR-associated protein Cmr1